MADAVNGISAVAAATGWLRNSGVREHAGGVRRAYYARQRRYGALYPEVTAYVALLDLRLWQRSGNADDLHHAVESGEWLLDVQSLHPGGAAFPYAVNDGPGGGWLTFDTALIGHAFVQLHAATGQARWADAAERCGRWVLAHQTAAGGFDAGDDVAALPAWAAGSGCLHAKNALLLAGLAKATGAAAWAHAARRAVDWVGTLQRADGGFDVVRGADWVFAHSHCYATEALLGVAMELNDASLATRALAAGRFLAAVQRPGGGIPRYAGAGATSYLAETGSRWAWLRARRPPCDVGATAQAARVWLWLSRMTGADFAEPLRRARTWLQGCRQRSEDVRIDGAFPAGVDDIGRWRRSEQAYYPWVAVFVADAWLLTSSTDGPVY